jgi:hypothetical protein
MIQTTPEVRELLDSIWEFLDECATEYSAVDDEWITPDHAIKIQDLIMSKSDYLPWKKGY